MIRAVEIQNSVEEATACLAEQHLRSLVRTPGRLLDLGYFSALHARLPDWHVIHSEAFSADCFRLPFDGDVFDATVARNVLERIDGQAAVPFLHEMARVTRHVICLPLVRPFGKRSTRAWSLQQPDGSFETYFSDAFLANVLKDCGFDCPTDMRYSHTVMPGAMLCAVRPTEVLDADPALPDL